MLQIEVRDRNRIRHGALPIVTFDAVLRYSGTWSTWSLTMDANHPKADRVVPGAGIIVSDDTGTVLLSGPVTNIVYDPDADNPQRTLTASGVGDEYLLYKRRVHPSPERPISQQDLVANYILPSQPAESAMSTLVDVNAGLSALAERQVPGLMAAPSQGRGSAVSVNSRYTMLGDDLDTLGTLGGLGWRVRQDASTNLIFECYPPADLTRRVQFSRDLATLGSFEYGLAAPDTTDVVVGGQGEGINRIMREGVNNDAELEWGMRLESFLDRTDTADDAEYTQAYTEELANNGPSATLKIDPLAVPNMDFLHILGATVTADIDGALVQDICRELTLSWTTDGGFTITPLIGNDAADDDPAQRRQLEARVRQLMDDIHRLKTGR